MLAGRRRLTVQRYRRHLRLGPQHLRHDGEGRVTAAAATDGSGCGGGRCSSGGSDIDADRWRVGGGHGRRVVAETIRHLGQETVGEGTWEEEKRENNGERLGVEHSKRIAKTES